MSTISPHPGPPPRGRVLTSRQQAQLRQLLSRCLEQAVTKAAAAAGQPANQEEAHEPERHRP